MNVPKCARCIYLLVILVVMLFGCNTAVKSVDYYNACLNDEQCVKEMQFVGNMTSTSVASAVGSSGSPSSVAQLVGSVAGSVVAYFVGVVRGKRIQKG